jgi:predicted secreted protein
VPSDAGASDYFGISCALSDDGSVLAVGAYFWDGGAGSNQGAVYVFDWNGSVWVERTTALVPSDAGAGDYFGASCALSDDGSVLAVGAYAWDGGAGSNQGAVYVFDGKGIGL